MRFLLKLAHPVHSCLRSKISTTSTRSQRPSEETTNVVVAAAAAAAAASAVGPPTETRNKSFAASFSRHRSRLHWIGQSKQLQQCDNDYQTRRHFTLSLAISSLSRRDDQGRQADAKKAPLRLQRSKQFWSRHSSGRRQTHDDSFCLSFCLSVCLFVCFSLYLCWSLRMEDHCCL